MESTTSTAAPSTPSIGKQELTATPAAEEVAKASAQAAPVVMTTQADARARFLRTKQPKFELAVVDGAEVALVVPPEGVRGEIQQMALDVDKSGKVRPGNGARRRALTVIAMVHTVQIDTTTGQKRPGARIFSDADIGVLVNEPSGPESVISLFAPKCEAVLDRIDNGVAELAKNG